jgi:replicative DNA helicase
MCGGGQVTDQLSGGDNAERALVGCVLIEPTYYGEAAQIVRPGDFRQRQLGIIWRAIGAMQSSGRHVDYVTLSNELQNSGSLETIGGAAYLTGLINASPSSLGYVQYAEIVRGWALRRQAIERAGQIARAAANGDVASDEIVEIAAQIAADFAGGSETGPETMGAIGGAVYDRAADLCDSGIVLGVKTGLPSVDKNLNGGLQPDELILIAARPGCGKSVFTLQAAVNAAKSGKRVLYWSGEMSKQLVFARAASAWIKANHNQIATASEIRNGKLTDWNPLTEAVEWSASLDMRIDDRPAVTAGYLRRRALAMRSAIGLDLIVIDYLGLMTAKGENRNQEISQISAALKGLAMEMHVPILAAQQLNRAIEARGTEARPQLSDLRDSGSLEQDADVVMFLYTKAEAMILDPRPVLLTCAKNRNGGLFQQKMTLFPRWNTLGEIVNQ